MNNSILIAIIISVGMVVSVIVSKGIDYYFYKEVISSTTEMMNKSTNNVSKSMPKVVKTKKIWIPGRPIDQCMKGEEAINNNVRRCTNGYYTDVLIR